MVTAKGLAAALFLEVGIARAIASQCAWFQRSPQTRRSRNHTICCRFCHPQTVVEVGKTHFRNVRSKCRCSMCLQFTLIHAVGCVLHRPTSQVIHRLEWKLLLRKARNVLSDKEFGRLLWRTNLRRVSGRSSRQTGPTPETPHGAPSSNALKLSTDIKSLPVR